jgi:hypothetical protein
MHMNQGNREAVSEFCMSFVIHAILKDLPEGNSTSSESTLSQMLLRERAWCLRFYLCVALHDMGIVSDCSCNSAGSHTLYIHIICGPISRHWEVL